MGVHTRIDETVERRRARTRRQPVCEPQHHRRGGGRAALSAARACPAPARRRADRSTCTGCLRVRPARCWPDGALAVTDSDENPRRGCRVLRLPWNGWTAPAAACSRATSRRATRPRRRLPCAPYCWPAPGAARPHRRGRQPALHRARHHRRRGGQRGRRAASGDGGARQRQSPAARRPRRRHHGAGRAPEALRKQVAVDAAWFDKALGAVLFDGGDAEADALRCASPGAPARSRSCWSPRPTTTSAAWFS